MSVNGSATTLQPSGTGLVAQSIIFLTADMCLAANPGVPSSIPARPHTFVVIYHEIMSMAIPLPSADSRRVVVSYKQKYVQELAQDKSVVR